MEIKRFSNSLLNTFLEYKKGNMCGKQLEEIYINKTASFEVSDEKQAGIWFEFITIGTLNKDKSEPLPVTISKGADAAITKHLRGQKENFDRIYKEIKQLEISKYLEIEINGIKFCGVLDVLAEIKEQTVIRDIKATGFIDNKFETYGWEMLQGNGTFLPEKSHLKQAQMYVWLWYELTGEIVPFYFDVFSNKNPNSCKTILINVDEATIFSFRENCIKLANELLELENLKTLPEMNRCLKCPCKCSDFTDIPFIEVIYI